MKLTSIKAVVIGLLASAFGVLVYAEAPRVEGYWFPVMGALTIEDPSPMPPPHYRTKWRGSADKLRDCSFVELQWFLGARNGRKVSVKVDFTDPPEVRGAGRLHFQGIVIQLDPYETRTNSHADVIHKCPWRPWNTRTPFYDPPQEGEG